MYIQNNWFPGVSNVVLIYTIFKYNVPFIIKAMLRQSPVFKGIIEKAVRFCVETAWTKTKFYSFKIMEYWLLMTLKYAVKHNLFKKY